MIGINNSFSSHRLCTACHSDDDVMELTFGYDNGSFFQGTQVALCKECRRGLKELLIEVEEEKADSDDDIEWETFS